MSEYKEVPPGLYAFWRHDLFPYLLGANITHMNGNGTVFVEGYGWGFGKHPVKIFPTAYGLEINRLLKDLEEERDDLVRELDKTFQAKLDDLLKRFGIP